MKQLPQVRRRRQKTAQQSLKRKNHWSGGVETLDAGKIKKAEEQYPNPKNEE